MDTVEALIICLLILVTGLALFYSCVQFTELVSRRKVVLRSIFKDFKQKMWMTIGLGSIFFVIYLLMVFAGWHLNNATTRLNLFFLVYEHPVVFIYIGLFVFAFVSTSIYLVRMIIKYLYNRKSRE